MHTKPLTLLTHDLLAKSLHSGDIAIDATVGNGYDTLFLAQQVGAKGKVYGFDIQDVALRNTHTLLRENDLTERVTLYHAGHEHIGEKIPSQHKGEISTVVFNLGYLPRSDKSIITHTDTTLRALIGSTQLIKQQGVITVMAYPGHAGGDSECTAVIEWCNNQSSKLFSISYYHSHTHKGPVLIEIRRL